MVGLLDVKFPAKDNRALGDVVQQKLEDYTFFTPGLTGVACSA